MNETLNMLTEQLHHADKNVRSQAALQLAKLNPEDALPLLLNVMGIEPDFYVREDITFAIVRMGDAAVLPVIERLRDANPAIRHHAAHVLSKLGDRRAVEGLIEALQDSDATVVTKAAYALELFKEESALPALVQVLGHEDREVQGMLDAVLKSFGAAAVQPIIDALPYARLEAREQAIDILGLIGGQDVIPVLMAWMRDPEWRIRFSVTNALGYIGGEEAKQALETLQNDPDSRVRSLASKMMARSKFVRARPQR